MTVPTPMIGTAGWAIPRPVADRFPEAGTGLERYSSVFPAVEINSSFHRPHRPAIYARWAASTPGAFRFSVKLPKTITHIRKLVDTDALLDEFFEQVVGLGHKLAVLLVQLPPKLAFDPDIARAFFDTLRRHAGANTAIACEPRNATWFAEEADACLRDRWVGRVAADPVLVPGGSAPGGWPGLRYHRLHGSPRVYYSAYEEVELKALNDAIVRGDQQDGATWCMFDNTASGAATGNALDLLSSFQASGD